MIRSLKVNRELKDIIKRQRLHMGTNREVRRDMEWYRWTDGIDRQMKSVDEGNLNPILSILPSFPPHLNLFPFTLLIVLHCITIGFKGTHMGFHFDFKYFFICCVIEFI
jgi:hypothetical protein